MIKENYYESLVTHVPNLMNAYHRFQYPQEQWRTLEDTLSQGQCIYEFTAHINKTNIKITDLQFEVDKMCSHFQSHLSRQLLGNKWKNTNKLHLQPMLITFFDHEGTRQFKKTEHALYPHIHGLTLLHDETLDRFMNITFEKPNESEKPNRRRYLPHKSWGFQEISFGNVFNGVNGLKTFSDYCLKFDKMAQASGDGIFTMDKYPKSNNRWNAFFEEFPDRELYKY